MKYIKNQRGFTLVELLIVIVIIGILAGVLITVINPQRQQNRARDAGVQATINKVALSTEGFIAAYGRSPNGAEFIGSLNNATGRADCIATNDFCTFEITGNILPSLCGANGWSGTGTNLCGFRYVADGDVHFKVVAKSHGIVTSLFVYDNQDGEISECPVTSVITSAAGACN